MLKSDSFELEMKSIGFKAEHLDRLVRFGKKSFGFDIKACESLGGLLNAKPLSMSCRICYDFGRY